MDGNMWSSSKGAFTKFVKNTRVNNFKQTV